MAKFNVTVDVSELATKLSQSKETIENKLGPMLHNVAVQAHTFIVQKAQAELQGFKQQAYLGKNGENLKFTQLGTNMWIIDLDQKAEWIENGRQKQFMDWLLNNNPKAKRAKDGTKYAHIPFKQMGLAGQKYEPQHPAYKAMITKAIKSQGINLRKIERNTDGSPRYGILHKLDIPGPGSPSQFPAFYSAPRSKEMAALTGLKPHEGIFKLQGAVVIQRPGKKPGSAVREVLTFRTISEKHKAEGRWFAPEQKPFNAFGEAHDWAKKQVDEIIKQLENELNIQG